MAARCPQMAERCLVEVALATPERQLLLALEVETGTSVAEVVTLSGIATRFPELSLAEMPVGIWGKPVSRDTAVRNGDRIELYRPLEIDPREARRQRALAGKQ